MAETVKRAALYIRVSTDEQAKHGFSLPEQKADLTAYAHEHGYFIAGVYADEGTTARKAISRRHALQHLLNDVQTGGIDIIIFKCIDRWIRSVPDYYKVQEILDAHGVGWECTQEEYNTTTTNGRLMLNLKLTIAQNESDQTSDRIKYIFAGKKRRGEFVTGALPFGYTVEGGFIVPDTVKAPIILDLFRTFAEQQNAALSMRLINARHQQAFTLPFVRRALRNSTYTGRHYGEENYHDAIIPPDLWSRVQHILLCRSNRTSRTGRIRLFAGLILCPDCGRRLVSALGEIRKTTGERYIFYRCSRHFVEKTCRFGRSIFEVTLERYLLTNMKYQLEAYAAAITIAEPASPTTSTDADIASLKEKLRRLNHLYLNGLIDTEQHTAEYGALRKALGIAERKKSAAHAAPAIPHDLLRLLQEDIAAMYERLTLENRRIFWQNTIDHIQVLPQGEYKIAFIA